MSAPRVVNTSDGTVWTRRGAMRGGEALYALAAVEDCPDLVMATLAELAEHGIAGSADVLPVPVGSELSDRDRLRAAYIEALDEAHQTHPCPQTGRPYWTGCVHYDENRRVTGVGSCHSERRADAVLAVRDAELERLRARIAELEAAAYVAPSPSCTRCYGADAARFVAKGGPTTPCRVCGPSQVEQLGARVAELEAERHTTNEALDDAAKALREQRDRIAELEAQREALAERLRAGQRWQRGRNPELVSENFVSQSELRSIFGIPLVAPWDEPAHADGITQRIAPTQPLRGRALLDALTVERAERTHNQRLGIEDPHDGPLCHTYRVGRDLPETGGAQ